jgi:hypothetical protein
MRHRHRAGAAGESVDTTPADLTTATYREMAMAKLVYTAEIVCTVGYGLILGLAVAVAALVLL